MKTYINRRKTLKVTVPDDCDLPKVKIISQATRIAYAKQNNLPLDPKYTPDWNIEIIADLPEVELREKQNPLMISLENNKKRKLIAKHIVKSYHKCISALKEKNISITNFSIYRAGVKQGIKFQKKIENNKIDWENI